MEIIEFRNVHKQLGNKQVLRGLNLTINKGEVMVIIGGSGEGKSVTLKHMMGLMAPDEGEVLIEGQDVSKMDESQLYQFREKFGMLFQYAALFDSLDVRENVGFA